MDDTRTALITGGSRGIGRAVAESLAGAGYRVGLIARNAHRLDDVVRELESNGATAHFATADVADFYEVQAAVAAIEDELGPIRLLINNAGTADGAEVPAWEADPDDWWRVLSINLRGAFHLIRAVVPGMVARENGRVVNVTGMIERGAPDYSAYASSKIALARLSESMAEPAAAHGVYVFDVSPGTVRTDLTASMPMMQNANYRSMDPLLDYIVAIGEGRLDALSGRYFHAPTESVDDLLARLPQLAETDNHRIRAVRRG